VLPLYIPQNSALGKCREMKNLKKPLGGKKAMCHVQGGSAEAEEDEQEEYCGTTATNTFTRHTI
jgi:hypothetical protein